MNIKHKNIVYCYILVGGNNILYTREQPYKRHCKKTNDKCRLYKYSLSYTSVFVKYDLLIKTEVFFMKENSIQIFENKNFGSIRTTENDSKTYFCGSDVAKALGYARPNDAISAHCRCTVKRSIPHPQSKNKTIQMSFISEGDVYRLIASSKLPTAQMFESWVFDEILPTIRKTGGYVANDDLFIQTYLPYADESTKSLFKVTLNTINQLNHKIKTGKPKVQFADSVANTENLIDIGTLAKLINDKYKKLGRNKLFVWLRDNGYLRHNNEPYQRYINSGIFTTREYVYNTRTGNAIGIKTYVTPKGQAYIINKVVDSLENN